MCLPLRALIQAIERSLRIYRDGKRGDRRRGGERQLSSASCGRGSAKGESCCVRLVLMPRSGGDVCEAGQVLNGIMALIKGPD